GRSRGDRAPERRSSVARASASRASRAAHGTFARLQPLELARFRVHRSFDRHDRIGEELPLVRSHPRASGKRDSEPYEYERRSSDAVDRHAFHSYFPLAACASVRSIDWEIAFIAEAPDCAVARTVFPLASRTTVYGRLGKSSARATPDGPST